MTLFAGQFVEDKETLGDVGDFLIYISALNLLINVLPITFPIFRYLYNQIMKAYRKYLKVKAQRAREKAMRERLRYRSQSEQEFGRKIELRANVAAENQNMFT
mmetsp:Transcript_40034/g.52422  ORF Transcript_40034/g.52422 Transcript_40034/m.52422 type:complete len:103 (-) Transcript_40034:1171-1479(-)